MSDSRTATVPAPATPGLLARCAGVLLSPARTMRVVAARPDWAGVLVLTALVAALCAGGLRLTAIGRQITLDQQVRTVEGFGRHLTDAQYADLRQVDQYGAAIGAAQGLLGTPLAVLAVALLLFGYFHVRARGAARFPQVLAVVAHAGVVLTLQQLIVTPLAWMRQTLASPTNLSALFPVFTQGSFLAGLTGSFDLFRLWWLAVLAIGLGGLYRRRAGPIFLGLCGVYLVVGIVLATIQVATGGV
ncbi:MAG: YIP1 family protein [Acidobacteriota bacterium]|nr:YIP1 family protein [Acidobacteriota bacterium]